MHALACHNSTGVSDHRRCILSADRGRRSDPSERRRGSLLRLDRELGKRNYRNAWAIAKQLQGKPGGLAGFGSAKQVPKRIRLPDDLKLNGMDLSYLSPLLDSTLDSIQSCLDFARTEDCVSGSGRQSVLLVEGNDQPLGEEVIFMCSQSALEDFSFWFPTARPVMHCLVEARNIIQGSTFAHFKLARSGSFPSCLSTWGPPERI